MSRDKEEWFWSQTAADHRGCLVWTGRTDVFGYGRVTWEGENRLAHRVSFLLRWGRWPAEGLMLRHACNNPPCVLHVVEGTGRQNQLDRYAAGSIPEAWATHCIRGHEFTASNTRVKASPDGGRRRFCRACDRERQAAIRLRRRAAAALKEAS